ncbi:MAG TPA: phage holin family protein [Casimicrobiaceae bacterium]|nr:phage holin family protein [Casimicrobiaceae bacterium]
MVDPHHPRHAGLGAALSRLGASALAMLHTRLELATVEFAEERERATEMGLLLLLTILLALFALLFASFFIIAYFWDSNRLTAVGAVTAFYVIAALLLLIRLRQRLRQKHSPFAATLSQIEEDAEALRRTT